MIIREHKYFITLYVTILTYLSLAEPFFDFFYRTQHLKMIGAESVCQLVLCLKIAGNCLTCFIFFIYFLQCICNYTLLNSSMLIKKGRSSIMGTINSIHFGVWALRLDMNRSVLSQCLYQFHRRGNWVICEASWL